MIIAFIFSFIAQTAASPAAQNSCAELLVKAQATALSRLIQKSVSQGDLSLEEVEVWIRNSASQTVTYRHAPNSSVNATRKGIEKAIAQTSHEEWRSTQTALQAWIENQKYFEKETAQAREETAFVAVPQEVLLPKAYRDLQDHKNTKSVMGTDASGNLHFAFTAPDAPLSFTERPKALVNYALGRDTIVRQFVMTKDSQTWQERKPRYVKNIYKMRFDDGQLRILEWHNRKLRMDGHRWTQLWAEYSTYDWWDNYAIVAPITANQKTTIINLITGQKVAEFNGSGLPQSKRLKTSNGRTIIVHPVFDTKQKNIRDLENSTDLASLPSDIDVRGIFENLKDEVIVSWIPDRFYVQTRSLTLYNATTEQETIIDLTSLNLYIESNIQIMFHADKPDHIVFTASTYPKDSGNNLTYLVTIDVDGRLISKIPSRAKGENRLELFQGPRNQQFVLQHEWGSHSTKHVYLGSDTYLASVPGVTESVVANDQIYFSTVDAAGGKQRLFQLFSKVK